MDTQSSAFTPFRIIALCVVAALFAGLYFFRGTAVPQQITIGSLLPLTGKFANLGEDVRNGLELARQDIHAAKGIDFRIVYEDSAADPKVAVPAAQKLIALDKVPLVFGGPGSSGNLAVAPLFEGAKVIFTAISSTPKLNSAGEYIFKIHPDIEGEVARSAKRMYDSGIKTVGLIYDTASDTNTVGKDTFLGEFEKLGGKVLLVEGYDSKTVTDFRTILTKIKAEKPDALFFLAIERVAGTAVKQAREIGLTQPIYGWSPFESDEFLKTAGSAAEGVIFTGLPFSCVGAEIMREYCAAYRVAYGDRVPLQYSAHAYHMLSILADVVEANAKRELVQDEVRAALTSRTYIGVSGDLKFDASGNITEKEFVFRTVEDGKFVDVR